MYSPFPGMDPYLEAPDIWPDLHCALSCQISAALNAALPALFCARVNVVAVEETPNSEPLRHPFVEVRETGRQHRLATLIEFVSPSNNRRGPDRLAFLHRQREILNSDSSLVVINLLRAGKSFLSDPDLGGSVRFVPAPDYLIIVNRAWRRCDDGSDYQCFPVRIREPLPCVPIPLREGLDETLLDLQIAFQRAYGGGPYRRGAIDYGLPPDPPLPGETAAWAEQLLRQQGLAGPPRGTVMRGAPSAIPTTPEDER